MAMKDKPEFNSPDIYKRKCTQLWAVQYGGHIYLHSVAAGRNFAIRAFMGEDYNARDWHHLQKKGHRTIKVSLTQ